jgi:plastocyanin
MPKSALVFLIAALILLGGLWFFFFYNVETNGNQESDANSNGRESLGVPAPGNEDVDEMIVEDSGDEVEGSSGTTKTVRINVEGYNPRVLEINVGDTVRWINEASRSNWPATDVHPSHTL